MSHAPQFLSLSRLPPPHNLLYVVNKRLWSLPFYFANHNPRPQLLGRSFLSKTLSTEWMFFQCINTGQHQKDKVIAWVHPLMLRYKTMQCNTVLFRISYWVTNTYPHIEYNGLAVNYVVLWHRKWGLFIRACIPALFSSAYYVNALHNSYHPSYIVQFSLMFTDADTAI